MSEPDATYAVEIAALSYAYPDGRQALCGIDLRIRPGERVALVGPNGAGKSTLLLHLNGILQGQGRVRILGREVKEPDLGIIRGLVGMVFQDADDQLFSLTVAEDVAYGPAHMGLAPAEVERRVAEALDTVAMGHAAGRVPGHLSGGEKKRVAMATVLSMQPAILVLDEPTNGLDPRARRRVIEVLSALPQTLLVSTHDMRLVAELAGRTVVLDEGQVVADGPTAEILADPVLLEAHGLESPWPAPPSACASCPWRQSPPGAAA